VLERQRDTLFVFVTTPPLALARAEPLIKVAAKRLLGRPTLDEKNHLAAVTSRKFHDWIVSKDGWLGPTPPINVAVFDYYELLTKQASSLYLAYPTGDGTDNHPSYAVNEVAARQLVLFLNRTARCAGIFK
jgi:hypothetical protein